jgi:hypothetical protein
LSFGEAFDATLARGGVVVIFEEEFDTFILAVVWNGDANEVALTIARRFDATDGVARGRGMELMLSIVGKLWRGADALLDAEFVEKTDGKDASVLRFALGFTDAESISEPITALNEGLQTIDS